MTREAYASARNEAPSRRSDSAQRAEPLERVRWRWFVSLIAFVRQRPLGGAASLMLALLICVAVLGPILAPFDPIGVSFQRLQGPSTTYLMGTDHYGRDVFSRVLHGAWISLYIGLGSAIVCAGVATLIGLMTGYMGGLLDSLAQRGVDAVMALPLLLLMLVLMMIIGASMTSLPLALGIIYGVRNSRVVRSAVLVAKECPYVDAARAIGRGTWGIMAVHIFRNIVDPIIVIATIVWGQAILVEATVSFLGFGVPPPLPSWGRMVSEGRPFLESAPWISIFSGFAITMAVYSLNMLGDALRDVLDPRLRH